MNITDISNLPSALLLVGVTTSQQQGLFLVWLIGFIQYSVGFTTGINVLNIEQCIKQLQQWRRDRFFCMSDFLSSISILIVVQ